MNFQNKGMTLSTISTPLKVLFSCLLLTIGMGYLFAVLYLYLVEIEPHVEHDEGIVSTVAEKYYGKREQSKLAAALQGAMGDNITPAEKGRIFKWIETGAEEASFVKIAPIFEDNCAICHSSDSGLPVLALTSYSEISALTRMDMGQSVKSLVRVSHVHLFGMSFIFFLTGGVFALSEISAKWRNILIAIPFIAIWVDIGSWWFTRLAPVFAYTVILGGILMGLSLLAQVLISLYEMWVPKRPSL